VLRLGRRSGKGRLASVSATYEATVNAPAHLAAVPRGERVSIVIVAPAQAQARIVHRYVRGFLHVPALAPLVVRDTDDEIELSNGITIETVPCSARSIRGKAAPVLIMDEAAWFLDSDGSAVAAAEVWQALAPATAQFPAGKVLVLSTPRWSVGWFADLCGRAASGEHPDLRTWHATTSQMNPLISESFLAAARALDPALFRREYEAEFDSGIGAVFPEAEVRAAVGQRGNLPPVPGMAYWLAVDPAFMGDTFAAIVGHREPGGRVLVDLVTGWRGTSTQPVAIEVTLDSVADLARAYNGAPVVIDQFAAEPIRQGLASRGLAVVARPWTNDSKVDAVAAVRKILYAGKLELPAHHDLLTELLTLEQRLLPSGRPRIAAAGGGHDDYAMTLLALINELDSHALTLAAIRYGLGSWVCLQCGHEFHWEAARPCPQCGRPAPMDDRPVDGS